jgi:hypothetical protein
LITHCTRSANLPRLTRLRRFDPPLCDFHSASD